MIVDKSPFKAGDLVEAVFYVPGPGRESRCGRIFLERGQQAPNIWSGKGTVCMVLEDGDGFVHPGWLRILTSAGPRWTHPRYGWAILAVSGGEERV